MIRACAACREKTLTVVANVHAHLGIRARRNDVDALGLGVLGDVGERLLDDAMLLDASANRPGAHARVA